MTTSQHKTEWPQGMPVPPKPQGIRESKPFIGQGCRPHANQKKWKHWG